MILTILIKRHRQLMSEDRIFIYTEYERLQKIKNEWQQNWCPPNSLCRQTEMCAIFTTFTFSGVSISVPYHLWQYFCLIWRTLCFVKCYHYVTFPSCKHHGSNLLIVIFFLLRTSVYCLLNRHVCSLIREDHRMPSQHSHSTVHRLSSKTRPSHSSG